ncbi:hypothetical protein EB796_017745 [Bugula neritina]|uniref:Molybdenum cofactor sulfurase middle domain-containing protein n=1 Tax=Bugula neritina TaxID=10212 RepID=A0A7J7JCP4_BUGNE|nr:hypothetical protein EB796_017745 [Bugula neritina]
MDSGSRSLMTVAAATLLFIPVMFYMLQRKKKSAMKTVAKVEKILVYPIKSCPPLVVDQAECTPVGMKYRKARDR